MRGKKKFTCPFLPPLLSCDCRLPEIIEAGQAEMRTVERKWADRMNLQMTEVRVDAVPNGVLLFSQPPFLSSFTTLHRIADVSLSLPHASTALPHIHRLPRWAFLRSSRRRLLAGSALGKLSAAVAPSPATINRRFVWLSIVGALPYPPRAYSISLATLQRGGPYVAKALSRTRPQLQRREKTRQ